MVKLARPAVIAFLIYECLGLTVSAVLDLERHHGLSAEEAWRQGIRSIPSHIANLVISMECFQAFEPEVLLASDLFFKVCDDDPWLLDIDEKYCDRGLLVPARNKRYGYYTDLLLFRHLKDSRPFSVRVRSDRKVAA